MIKFTFLVLSLSLCSWSEPSEAVTNDEEASHEWYDEPRFVKCMDDVDVGFFKNSKWLECHKAELVRIDLRLNETYTALKQRLAKPEDRSRLVIAQRKWIGYRDEFCRFRAGLDLAPTPEINEISCLIELSVDQAEKLAESY